MTLKSAQDLLLNELRDIYDAEKQLVKALPKMAKAPHPSNCAKPSRGISRKPRPRSSAWNGPLIGSIRALAASAARRCRASSRRPAR